MRPQISWSDLRDSRVGIWGLGIEGRASLRKLRTLGLEPTLVDDQPSSATVDDLPVLATATGGMDALTKCDFAIKAPGISRYRADVRALSNSVPILGALGLWVQAANRERVICVTGTKGKSTTAALVAHLITSLGYRCFLGGNIGRPPHDSIEESDFDFWVIEVSSFQATDFAVSPRLVAVTSLSPDHLDWHGNVENYYRDKLSLCSQPGAMMTIANGTDVAIRERGELLGPQLHWITVDDADERFRSLQLPGRHNRSNAAIALGCLDELGLVGDQNEACLDKALGTFKGLPSRLEPVALVDGVEFIDDSLSTNVLPTIAALDAFPGRRVALLVGGFDRGIDYAPLARHIAERNGPLLVVALPDTGRRVISALRATASESRAQAVAFESLEAAVPYAHAWARPDGVVLLSPAAASFNAHANYRERSAAFLAAISLVR